MLAFRNSLYQILQEYRLHHRAQFLPYSSKSFLWMDHLSRFYKEIILRDSLFISWHVMFSISRGINKINVSNISRKLLLLFAVLCSLYLLCLASSEEISIQIYILTNICCWSCTVAVWILIATYSDPRINSAHSSRTGKWSSCNRGIILTLSRRK
jgi:hypothetical protein